MIIGWVPDQHTPIHDHHLGGGLQRITKGPVLFKRFFFKTDVRGENTTSGTAYVSHIFRNETGIYSCFSSLDRDKNDSCQFKKQSKAMITETSTGNSTMDNENFYVEGYDLMNSVENLNSQKILSMHYYLESIVSSGGWILR